jgi:hypothetical protein
MSDAAAKKTRDESDARRMLVRGAAVVAGGLAIAGTANQTFGGVVVVLGWLLLVWGIHKYGRAR